MKKRLLSILLTIACISTLLPTTARAEYPGDVPADTANPSSLITSNDDLLIEKPDNLNTVMPMVSLNECILFNGFYYLIHDDKLFIHGSVHTTGDLVIPETLDGYPVYGIAYRAFWGNGNRYHLTSVHIPASVEVIDAMAFADLDELEHVTFAEGSKLREIWDAAFDNCHALQSITIPASVTDLMALAFFNCYALTSITFEEGSRLKNIGDSCFAGTPLASIELPDSLETLGDNVFEGTQFMEFELPSGLKHIGELLFMGSPIERVILPEELPEGTDFGSMVLECKNFKGFDTSKNPNYSSTDEGFYTADGKTLLLWYGTGATEITVPDGVETIGREALSLHRNTVMKVVLPETVTRLMPSAFESLWKLVHINIPSGITEIPDRAFASLYADLYGDGIITLPDGVTRIGDYGLGGFSLRNSEIPTALEEIGMGAFTLSRDSNGLLDLSRLMNLKKLHDEAFWGGGYITTVILPDSLTYLGDSAFFGCNYLESVTFGTGPEYIGAYAFANCTRLKSIELPEGIVTYGTHVVDQDRWGSVSTDIYGRTEGCFGLFQNCGSLKSVTLPEDMTKIPNTMFRYCEGLESIEIPSSVAEIEDSAFSVCTSLKSITLPEGLTALKWGAFQSCYALEEIELPDTLEVISGAVFLQCCSLTNIFIPQNVREIGEDYLFDGCSALKEISVAKGNQNYSSLDGILFSKDQTVLYKCPEMKSIPEYRVPDTVTRLGDYAFANNQSLVTIILPEGLKEIGYSALDYCLNLTNFRIPDSVTHIGGRAFSGCSKLTEVVFPKNVKTFGGGVLAGCTGLTYVTIPDGVTLLPGDFFMECTNLWGVTLPRSVREIGLNVLMDCPSLEVVNYTGSQAEWKGTTFLNTWQIPDWVEKMVFNWTAPELLAPTLTVDDNLTLRWTAVSGARTYEIYRAIGESGTFEKIATTENTALSGDEVQLSESDYYKVRAVYGDTKGEFSLAVRGDGTQQTVLAAPTVKATNISSTGKIQISWNKVDGAVKYEVWRATSKNGTYTKLTTTTKTSINNTKINAGETYYYKVKAIAKSSAANSAYSTPVGRTCDLAQPKVTVSNISSTGKIKLSWNKVDGAVKYEVWRATSKNGTYTKLTTTTKTSINNTKINAGETYYYKVKAIAKSSAANSAYSTPVGRTCDLARPEVTVKLSSKGKPIVSWNAVSGAVKYEVWRSTSKNGTYTRITTTTRTSITNTKTEAGVTYYYKVRAIAKSSAASSAFSSVVYIKAK